MPPPADPTSHPDEDTLESYALGRLPESEVVRIEEHLLVCHPCQDALKELDEYVTAMKGALAEQEAGKVEVPPMAAPWWRKPTAIPLAAGVVIAAGLGLMQATRQSVEPVELTLRSLRGGGPQMAEAPAGSPLRLQFQSEQFQIDSTYRVRIVDAQGGEVWNGAAPSNGAMLPVDKPLDAGMHWVRLYDASGTQVQEYGLQVK